MSEHVLTTVPDESAQVRRLEDKNLVLSFQGGDASAYDRIYQRHSARVTAVCRRMLMDPHDVEEAKQEVFLRVYQALGRFNGRYEVGAWIARIATNVCLDQLRAKNRRPHDFAPLEALDSSLEATFDDATPEAITLQRAEGRRVKKVLAGMPPMHRAAIVLRDFEGFSYEEIAKTLGITEAQVKALLHRARQAFKRNWAASIASIFIPTRVLQRLKLFGSPNVEHAATGLASPQVVSSCSTLAQQCGQFMVDKVAPVVTALGVGLAAGVAVGNAPEPPAPREIVATKPSAVPSKVREGSDKKERPEDGHGSAEEQVVPEPVVTTSPSPEGSPTGEPSEDPAGAPGNEGEPRNTPSASPSPTPLLSPSIGFGTPRASMAREHSYSMDCASGRLDQDLVATMAHGEKTYPVALDVDANSGGVRMTLLVYPEGEHDADVEYSATGSRVEATQHGDRLTLAFSGTYDNTDAPDANWKQLPESGTFDLRVELDCSASSVVSETLTLSA